MIEKDKTKSLADDLSQSSAKVKDLSKDLQESQKQVGVIFVYIHV